MEAKGGFMALGGGEMMVTFDASASNRVAHDGHQCCSLWRARVYCARKRSRHLFKIVNAVF